MYCVYIIGKSRQAEIRLTRLALYVYTIELLEIRGLLGKFVQFTA
jgi:hypothetical protein